MLNGNNYIPVTQATIDAAKKTHHNCPNNHVAAVSITQNEPPFSSAPEPSVHLVTAIMLGIMNPVTYHAANNTTVLDGSDDSDDEVSALRSNFIGAFIESVEAIANSPTLPESPKEISEISPLMVPHLFWRALASPPRFPTFFV